MCFAFTDLAPFLVITGFAFFSFWGIKWLVFYSFFNPIMASKTKDSSDEYEFTLDIYIPPEVLPQTTAQAKNTELLLIDTDTNMEDNSPTSNQNQPNNDSPMAESENDSSDNDNDDDELPYEIKQDDEIDNLPHYPIDNKIFQVHEDDIDWKRENRDSRSFCGPFIHNPSTIIDLTNPKLELFFNQLFDDKMWTIIMEATNEYSRMKSNTPQGKTYIHTYIHTNAIFKKNLFRLIIKNSIMNFR